MPLELFATRMSYRASSRSVVIAGICEGRLIDVVVPRGVIEQVGGRSALTQDESIAAVSKYLEILRQAAAIGAARNGMHVAVTVIELDDLKSPRVLDEAEAGA